MADSSDLINKTYDTHNLEILSNFMSVQINHAYRRKWTCYIVSKTNILELTLQILKQNLKSEYCLITQNVWL